MRPRLALLLDATVPLMAAVVVLGAAYSHSPGRPDPLAILLSVAACVALTARRAYPVGTVAITATLVLPVAILDADLAPYAPLVPAGALFSAALSSSRTRQIVGGGGCLALTVLAEALNQDRPGLLLTLQHVALLVGAIVVVEALRTRRDYRSVLGERLALVKLAREQEAQRRVQDERLRIARDLHDLVAHTLTTINVQASVARHLLDTRPEQAGHALAVIEEASRDGIGELRAILGVLRESDSGASRAPIPGLDDVGDLIELAREAGLWAELDVVGERPARLPEAVSQASYRIVQESLTNAARHADGADVAVRLSFAEDELLIAVENTISPTGKANGAPGASARVGIVGMTERAHALGGTLTASPSETGFLVSARLPFRVAQ